MKRRNVNVAMHLVWLSGATAKVAMRGDGVSIPRQVLRRDAPNPDAATSPVRTRSLEGVNYRALVATR